MKLWLVPIGVQREDNAQQCMSRVSVNNELVMLKSFKLKLVLVPIFHRLVKLTSPLIIKVLMLMNLFGLEVEIL